MAGYRLSLFGVLIATIVGSNAWSEVLYVKEMTAPQLAALDRAKTAVILPGGILEQHGPYLPSYSDGYMNERFTEDLADAIAARAGWNALVFPVIPLGSGGANQLGYKHSFPGTYAIRFETLRAVFMDLASELGEQGFRWIFVVHVHGAPNHNRALDQASDYFHDVYGGEMVHLFGIVLREEKDLRTRDQRTEDGLSIHAGMAETSNLLHLRPDLVDPGYTSAPPVTARGFGDVVAAAREPGWSGYLGSPRLASAEFGADSWRQLTTLFVDLSLRILDGYEYRSLPRLANLMSVMPASADVNEAALKRDAAIERKQRDWISQQPR
jgi:creatinine amidohydrolase/Fe(II)-dependent formamide hydrolase-like protein